MNLEVVDILITLLTIILLLLGLLFALFPKLVVQMNRLGNRVIFRDEVVLNRLRGAGIALVILGVFVILNIWIRI